MKSHDYTDIDTPLVSLMNNSFNDSTIVGVTNTVNYQSTNTLSEFKKIIKSKKKKSQNTSIEKSRRSTSNFDDNDTAKILFR